MTSRRSKASLARTCTEAVEKRCALAELLEGRTLLSVANPSFEPANLSGWETVEGSDIMAEVVGQFGGKTAIAGDQFAKISALDWSALSQTFTAAAGATLSGWAFFHSNNGRFAHDEARIEIRRGDDVVARPYFMNSEMLGRNDSTPWTAWSYTFAEAGTYTIRAIAESGTICPAAVTLGLDALEIFAPPAVVAQADAYTVDVDQLVVAAPGVLSNDTARDGGALSMQLVTGPEYGTLTFTADGSFTYVPASGYDGLDSFTYAARDAAGNIDEATVTLTIPDRPEPEHPTIENIRFSTLAPKEGERLTLEGRVTNPRGLPQTISIDWGDGTQEELDLGLGVSFAASHRYEDPGTYIIRVTPRDDAPGTPESLNLRVADIPPLLGFTGAPAAAAGMEYVIELRGREGQDEPITSWTIDWGDGSVQTLEGNPGEARHTYAGVGSYRVLAWAMLDGELTAASYATTRLDRDFGDEGIIVRDFGTSEILIEVLRDAQGRLLLIGTSLAGSILLQRLLPDGTPDVTFGDDGVVTWDGARQAHDGTIQGDGKILITASSNSGALVARFNDDGTIDDTFSIPARALELSGGGIVLATHETIQRYTTAGTLDTTFGDGGTAPAQLSGVREVVGADGAILATGSRPGQSGLHLLRLRSDGTLDTAFGDGGYVLLPLQTGSYGDGDFGTGVRALAVAPDGKILVGGTSDAGRPIVVRLNQDGSLDDGFGSNGAVQLNVSGAVLDLELDDEGRIVASGSVNRPIGFALFRFTSDGRPDDTFGDGGVFMVDFPGALELASSVVIDDDGAIIAAGLARPGLFDFAVAKVISDHRDELTVVVG